MTELARSEQIAVEGGAIAVSVQGAGPLVVLIHGTAPAEWGDLPSRLAADHRVAVYDRRSFGSAGALAAAGLSQHARDAAAVISALGGPATVVGWSIGGVIALELAARSPDLVTGLVLIEPPLHAKRHPRPRMVGAIAGATVLGRLGRREAGARRFLRWALGAQTFAAMPPDWHARLAAGDGAAVVGELAAGTGEHLDAALLGAVQARACVLRGDRSEPVFRAAADRIATAVGAAVVDVPEAGHALHLDAPEAVVDAVTHTTDVNATVA